MHVYRIGKGVKMCIIWPARKVNILKEYTIGITVTFPYTALYLYINILASYDNDMSRFSFVPMVIR